MKLNRSNTDFKRLAFALVLVLGQGVTPVEATLKLADKKVDTNVAPFKGIKTPLEKKGNYALPTGFTFDAVMSNAIFSYNLLTPAIAVVEDEITFLGEVVIPKDTKFIGTVEAVHSLDRVNISFKTCVFPDGQEIRIDAIALSPDGSAGVIGTLETHKDSMAAKTAMKTIFSATAAVASVAPAPTVGDALASNLSSQASNSIDTSGAKELDSISTVPKAPIKIFISERTQY